MIEILKHICTFALIAIVIAGAIIPVKIIGVNNFINSILKIQTREKLYPFIILIFFWAWLFNPNSTSQLLSIFVALLILELPLYYALKPKYPMSSMIMLGISIVLLLMVSILFNAKTSNIICDNCICKITTQNGFKQQLLPEKTVDIKDIQSFDIREKLAFNKVCASQYYITAKYKNGKEDYLFKSPSCKLDTAKEAIETLNQGLNNSNFNVNFRYPD